MCVCVCVCKMSSGAERLTKKRKITVETYTKNQIHTVYVYAKEVLSYG